MDDKKKPAKGPKKITPRKGAKLTLTRTDLRRLVDGLVIVGGTRTTRGPACPLSPVMQTCGAGDPCNALRDLLKVTQKYEQLAPEERQQFLAAAHWLAKR